MSNPVTALALMAKDNPKLMETLWLAVKRLIGLWACKHGENRRLYDLDDLMQSGYLALHDAVQGFDPEAGMEFTTYLNYHIRGRFAEVSGRRGSKTRPELGAVSLDAPLDGDDASARIDFIADPESRYIYDDLTERIGNRQMYDAIIMEMQKLPDEHRRALELTLIGGKSYKAAAEIEGCAPDTMRKWKEKGLRKLRGSKACRLVADDFRHVSLSRFHITHTSQVEEEVLRRLGL